MYKIVSENYFCAIHKNRWKRKQHLKLLFFEKNMPLGTSKWISKYKTLNLFHISSVYLVFSSLEMKIHRPKYSTFFCIFSERYDLQTSNVAEANHFSSVQISLASMNAFSSMWYMKDNIIHKNLLLLWGFF